MLTVTPSISLVSTDTLARYFAAGASLAARSIRYPRAAGMILADQLTAERIVRLFSSSASTKWRQDAAMIVLCGSMAGANLNVASCLDFESGNLQSCFDGRLDSPYQIGLFELEGSARHVLLGLVTLGVASHSRTSS